MAEDRYIVSLLKGIVVIIVFFMCLRLAHGDELDQVATRALLAAKHSPTGTRYEHGGFIALTNPFGVPPVYRFQEPEPHGAADHVNVFDSRLLGLNEELVATYHLHLCMNHYLHHYFSTQDVVSAYISGVPEYMLDECDGAIHKFDPKIDHVRDSGQDFNIDFGNCRHGWRHLPVGRIIGYIGEMEPMVDNPDDVDNPACPRKH